MCVVLAILAVPLARLRPRQGRYARVWIAVVIFFEMRLGRSAVAGGGASSSTARARLAGDGVMSFISATIDRMRGCRNALKKRHAFQMAVC